MPAAAVKSPAARLAVTVAAVTTSLLLYVPAVCVTLIVSPVTRPLSEKFAPVNVAVVFPLYGLLGLPMIDALMVSAVMWLAPLALVEFVDVPWHPACHCPPTHRRSLLSRLPDLPSPRFLVLNVPLLAAQFTVSPASTVATAQVMLALGSAFVAS